MWHPRPFRSPHPRPDTNTPPSPLGRGEGGGVLPRGAPPPHPPPPRGGGVFVSHAAYPDAHDAAPCIPRRVLPLRKARGCIDQPPSTMNWSQSTSKVHSSI